MKNVTIRSAKIEDLDFAFEMSVEAGTGMIERFLGCGSKDFAYKVFKSIWQGKSNRFHYENAKIVMNGYDKAGFIVSYRVDKSKKSSLNILQLLTIGGFKMFWYYLTHIRELITALSLPEGKQGEYYISTIAIHSSQRGQGVGTMVILDEIETAKRLDLKTVSLIVDKNNSSAKKLYERMGFIVDQSSIKKSSYRMTLDLQ